MLHLTVVEGEGLTPDVDYVLRSEQRIRVAIANDDDKSSIILDFDPSGEIKIKFTENFTTPKLRLEALFEGKLKDLINNLNN